MIDSASVLGVFRERYSSEIGENRLLALCTSACSELEYSLRAQADTNDIRLICLAAAMVNYRLCVKNLSSDEGVVSFRAGDVSVTVSPEKQLENAENELLKAQLSASALLKDKEFLFRQVKA